MQWTFRIALLAMFVALSYFALLPGFRFDTLITAKSLVAINIPEKLAVAIHAQVDKIAHVIGAFTLIILYKGAMRPEKVASTPVILLVLFTLAVAAEIAQYQIGRGFSVTDIVVGMIGGALALVLLKNPRQNQNGRSHRLC